MPDSKISQKPAIGALDGTELMVFVQNGGTHEGTVADIKTYMGAAVLNNLVGYSVRAGNANGYRLSYRSDVGSFPAAYVSPLNNNSTMAFDVFPKGASPVESVGNGFAWTDICSTDLTINGVDIQVSRIGITSQYAYVSSQKFGAATLLPFAVVVDGIVQALYGINGVFNTPLVNRPAYANNAAAITGGLVAGDHYRTGGDPDLLCIVH